ncbi:ATP-binding protein [Aquimarina sp. W85]|uniref:ATP-binding protein n=1 Tax=Aquimarina rhodophyticola TaxID=3342246 RepID=UPI00366C15A3
MINSQKNSITTRQDKNHSENKTCLTKIIFDNLSDPVVLLDDKSHIIESNLPFLELLNTTANDVLNKSFFTVYKHKWNHLKIKSLIESALLKPTSFSLKTQVKIDDKHFETSVKKIFITKGSPVHLLVTLKEITDSKKLENRLLEQIHNYDQLIYLSPYLIAILKGEDLRIEIANDTILENWGKGKNVIGKPLLEVIPEIKEQGFENLLLQVMHTGKAYHAFEVPAEHFREGKRIKDFYDFAYQPIFSLNGKVEKVAVIAINVSKQKELHHKISENEKKFRQMIDLLPDKIISADATGEIIYYNKSWQKYTGLGLQKLQNKGWTKIIHPDDKKEFFKKLNIAYQTGHNQEMEVRCQNKTGAYKWHLYRTVAIHDEISGKIKSWLSTCTEIHKVKEEQRRKEEFLKMVSHELKTPVTSIKGYVQLLLSMIQAKEAISKELLPVQKSLKRIDSQVSRLTRLISEMLDLSRVENSKLELKKTVFNLNELVYETVEDIKFSSDIGEVQFRDDISLEVYADRDRIGQVLINLITNAIKYAPKNQLIEISIVQKNKDYGAISIKDYGIGISKKDLSKIFDRFYRVEGENETTFSGFGIGLFLVKEIVDRHGGMIEVESKKGKGSKFTFTLPLNNFNKNT